MSTSEANRQTGRSIHPPSKAYDRCTIRGENPRPAGTTAVMRTRESQEAYLQMCSQRNLNRRPTPTAKKGDAPTKPHTTFPGTTVSALETERRQLDREAVKKQFRKTEK